MGLRQVAIRRSVGTLAIASGRLACECPATRASVSGDERRGGRGGGDAGGPGGAGGGGMGGGVGRRAGRRAAGRGRLLLRRARGECSPTIPADVLDQIVA